MIHVLNLVLESTFSTVEIYYGCTIYRVAGRARLLLPCSRFKLYFWRGKVLKTSTILAYVGTRVVLLIVQAY